MRKVVTVFLFMIIFQFGTSYAEANGPFSDMPTYGTKKIEQLTKDHTLLENPDGTLRPYDRVTRAEAMTLIGRALKLNGEKRVSSFKDVPSTHYASGSIASKRLAKEIQRELIKRLQTRDRGVK